MKFFYDGQIRRYLLQIMRVFGNIKYQKGDTISTIPVVYGDQSRMVAQILNGQTQNAMLPVPMISVRILGLEVADNRRTSPTKEHSIHYTEREFSNGQYNNKPGKKVTIDRYMPVPYDLSVQVDIWTSNTESKLQILEQIMTIFNPSIQLTSSDSIADWTSVFELKLDKITWTNRSIPTGSNIERDVSSLVFGAGIWINPPAKIKRQNLIETIISDVNSVSSLSDKEVENCLSGDLMVRSIVTPGDFDVSLGLDSDLANNELKLEKSSITPSITSWEDLFKYYGTFIPGETKIILKTNKDVKSDEDEIYATVIDYGTREDSIILEFDQSTLPSATLKPIIGSIDPAISWPGKDLSAPSLDDGYLIVSETSNGEESAVPDNHPYWGTFDARPGDIIRYDGTEWYVVTLSDNEYVYSNEAESLITNTGGSWEYAYLGLYRHGFWRIADISNEATYEDLSDNDSAC